MEHGVIASLFALNIVALGEVIILAIDYIRLKRERRHTRWLIPLVSGLTVLSALLLLFLLIRS